MTSLRQKMLLQFLVIMVIALLAVTLINYVQAKGILETEIKTEALKYVEGKSNEIDLWLSARVAEIEAYAQTAQIKSMDWKNQQEQYLKSEAERLSAIYEILFITDPEGNFETTLDAKGNVGDRDYFPVVMSGKTAISDPVISKSTGQPIIVVATPIKNAAGEIAGVMAGTVHMDTFNEIIGGMSLGRTGYGYAINKQGLMLASPNKEDVLNKNILQEPSESLQKIGQKMVAGEEDYGFYEINGSERFVCFSQIGKTGWTLAVAVPYNELTEKASSLLFKSIAVSIFALIVLAIVIWLTARNLVRPITNLAELTENVAGGDLTQEAEIRSKDEVGQLAQNFNLMINNLKNLINQIKNLAVTLSSAAQELSVSSEEAGKATQQVAVTIGELASAAGEQANAVDQSNRLMAEMATTINQVASNAGDVAMAAAQASELSAKGVKTLNNLSLSIDQSTQSFVSVSGALDSLIGNAKQINEFVDAVTNIAGQTNLLALNAAIEAARAGEQGRGFAVVAEEVRKLAEDSAEAAAQIANLLKKINKGIDGVLNEVGRTDSAFKFQAEAVRNTETAFSEINASVERANHEIQEVSAEAEEMAASTEEIVKFAESIAATSQEAAAGTEEVSASAEEQSASIETVAQSAKELAELAEKVEAVVQQFKLEG